ncbi:hypothetical protein NC652_036609 [Populus alba x Populus x berolinensis]|nr:hypothetical protein NC652_036609 [Populus alba x Populus x berolinensis]
MAPESNFHSPGTLEFMHTHMGSFQLHSAPETGMGREQVVQERERNTRDNLSLLVKDYGIDISKTTGGGSPERLADNEDEPRGNSVPQPCSSLVNNAVITMNAGVNMATEPEQPVVRGSSHEMLPVIQDKPRKDSSQPENLMRLGPGRYDDQLCTTSLNNNVIMNDEENLVREPGHRVARDSSLEGLLCVMVIRAVEMQFQLKS